MDRLSNLERNRAQVESSLGAGIQPTTTLESIMEGFDGRASPDQSQVANYDPNTMETSLHNVPDNVVMGDTVEVSVEGPRVTPAESPRPYVADTMPQHLPQLETAAHDTGNGIPNSPHSTGELVAHSDPAGAEKEIRSNNGAAFRPTFDIFFRYLNPLHPLINENQFRSQFDNIVFDHGEKMTPHDRLQFTALVYLIAAEVELLNGDYCALTNVLGWSEICTADSIIGDMIWRKTTNLLTIQCLVVKTRCLLCLERFNHAYDTMAAAKRISVQIGLHDESKWIQQDVDEFDKAMRRRVFWCLFTLGHVVGASCDLPPTLWFLKHSVALPQPVDDRSFFPNRPIPEASPETSFIPYLHSLVEWAELFLEAWELIHNTSSEGFTPEEQYALLDQKILLQIKRLPSQLQFSQDGGVAVNRHRLEPFHLRQRQISHLVSVAYHFHLRSN